MSEEAKIRKAFIEFYNKVGDVTLTCNTFGISRPTFYKWYKRYDPLNPQSLEDQPKTPKTRRKSTLSSEQEKRIRELRMKHMDMGKDRLKLLYQSLYAEPISTHHVQHVIQKYKLYPQQTVGEIDNQETTEVQDEPSWLKNVSPLDYSGYSAPSKPFELIGSGVAVRPRMQPQRRESPQAGYQVNPLLHLIRNVLQQFQIVRESLDHRSRVRNMKPGRTKKERVRKYPAYAAPAASSLPGVYGYGGAAQSDFGRKALIVVGVSFVIFISIAPAYFFFKKYEETQEMVSNPTLAARQDTLSMIEKVRQYVELPEDEEPSIVTVSDRDKLRGHPFFSKAKNGDKVLIYSKAKKAVLYDPVEEKIVNVALITSDTPSVQSTLGVESPTRIAIYNGTDVPGLTKIVEEKLEGKVSGVDVVLRDNANRDDYGDTIVVDLTSGKKRVLAESVATAMNGIVGRLPESEDRPVTTSSGGSIEILVIVGRSYLAGDEASDVIVP